MAAVGFAFLAAFGGSQASEGNEAGSEENGELDHFGGGVAFGSVFRGYKSLLNGLDRVLDVVDELERAFYRFLGPLFIDRIPELTTAVQTESSNLGVSDFSRAAEASTRSEQ